MAGLTPVEPGGPGPQALPLVIGYGNPLRGDDAAGWRVAAAAAAWEVPRVRAEAVQQLTPELAERLAPASLVVFVDARRASEGAAVCLQRLEPTFSVTALGHTSDPRYLLALAQTVYGRSPPAWWVTVPATDFELRGTLSPPGGARCPGGHPGDPVPDQSAVRRGSRGTPPERGSGGTAAEPVPR
jgi:hydrogenase maturation protease